MKKKGSKVKQVIGYKAIISRMDKDIEVLEATKVQTFEKLEYSFNSMTDFMDKSRSTFESIVIKIVPDKMIFERQAIDSLIIPYSEIHEISKFFEPFNFDIAILQALKTGPMDEDKLRYTVLKESMEHTKVVILNIERMGELLIQFHSAKIKLIEIFPQLAKFNSGVN